VSRHPSSGTHLEGLTSLRFVAAMHVVLFHEARGFFGVPAVERFVDTGYIGVQLFFVLSGFILAYTYADGRTAHVSSRSFFIARFARVYPVYALALVVALPQLVSWGIGKVSLEHGMGAAKVVTTVLANVLLLQAWLVPTVSPWNAPGWSLSVEASFYLVFPALIAWLVTLRDRRLLLTVLGVWLLSLLPPVLYEVHDPGSTPDNAGMRIAALKYLPFTRVGEFVVGVGSGVLFRRYEARHKGGSQMATWSALLIVALLASPLEIPYPLRHNALFAPLFAILILGLAQPDSWLAGALSVRPLVLLGQASYAMYLLHEPVAWLLYKNEYGPLRSVDALTRLPIYLLVVVTLSTLVFKYWEEPVRRMIRRRGATATPGDYRSDHTAPERHSTPALTRVDG
jgi:peptidoglycan/LPS O-acetylase OafA/YrhL